MNDIIKLTCSDEDFKVYLSMHSHSLSEYSLFYKTPKGKLDKIHAAWSDSGRNERDYFFLLNEFFTEIKEKIIIIKLSNNIVGSADGSILTLFIPR